jgi:predicted TPR repeat methyltransferase
MGPTPTCRYSDFAAESAKRQAYSRSTPSDMNEAVSSDQAETAPAALTEGGLHLQMAMQAHRESDIPAARGHYERALELEPDNPDALHMYGVLLAAVGRFEQAHQSISRAVAILPGEAMFHNNLGNALLQLERLEEAEQSFRQAIMLDSDRFDAMNNVAVLMGRRERYDDAERVFRRLLEVVPGFVHARENLVHLYIVTGRISEAVRECAQGLVTSPRARGLRHMLGLCYGALGWREQAVALYRDWLEEEPDNVRARHHYAAYSGEGVPDQASSEYVRETFDGFAGSFESKLAELGYRAPGLVVDALSAAAGQDRTGLRIADAGCGTGLCGPLLRPMAGQLVGVDLSEPMLERAATKKVYDELVAGDLVEFLRSRPGAFDAIVSADTLCYFGVLEGFAAAARASLDEGGALVFTVESVVDDTFQAGWQLQTHGRYAHRRDYVEKTLHGAGFTLAQIEAVTLREEAKQPVAGWLVSAIATG